MSRGLKKKSVYVTEKKEKNLNRKDPDKIGTETRISKCTFSFMYS